MTEAEYLPLTCNCTILYYQVTILQLYTSNTVFTLIFWIRKDPAFGFVHGDGSNRGTVGTTGKTWVDLPIFG